MGRVECPAQEQNTLTQAGLEPRPLDPESSTLNIGNNMSPTVVSKWQCSSLTKKKHGALLRSHSFLIKYRTTSHYSLFGLFKLKNLSTSNIK